MARKIKWHNQTYMSLFLILISIWAIYESSGWDFATRLFPLAISIPILILSIIQFLQDIMLPNGTTVTEENDFALRYMGEADATETDHVLAGNDAVIKRKRTVNILLWMLGYMVAMVLFGVPITSFAFVALFLLLEAREKWWISLCFGAVIWLLIVYVLVNLVHLTLPRPLLPFF